jgi:hypothetical protein
MGGFDGRFVWIKVVCEQQLGYWVPGPVHCETIISVDVVLVKSYLDGFLDETIQYDTLYGGHESDAGVGSGRRRRFLYLYGFVFSTTLCNVFVIELRYSVLISVAKTVFSTFDVYCGMRSIRRTFLYTTLSEVEF